MGSLIHSLAVGLADLEESSITDMARSVARSGIDALSDVDS